MWSEEEMRDIEPEPRPRATGAKMRSSLLRSELSVRNVTRAVTFPHELTRGSQPGVIYAPEGRTHGNFIEASYARVCAHPEWRKRLAKAHTAKRQGRREAAGAWCELDSANSSDALLMNIFCYPRVMDRPALAALLGIDEGMEPRFGVRVHVPLSGGQRDTTEIDMRLPGLLVEAKLTESDFQVAPMRLLERYQDLDVVFDRSRFALDARGSVHSYQLIRGVLAACARDCKHCVMLDARRPDLIEAWYAVVSAVRSVDMQSRLRVLTWQEIARMLPVALQSFLETKYGICD